MFALKMGQAQINVRTRACSGTFIARTKQAALTHNVRGKRLRPNILNGYVSNLTVAKGKITCLYAQSTFMSWLRVLLLG